MGCTFFSNTAVSAGGAIVADQNLNLNVSDTKFIANTTDGQGGAGWFENCDVVFNQCTFSRNLAGTQGGALQLRTDVNAQIVDCTFSGNAATGSGTIDTRWSLGYSHVELLNTLITGTTDGVSIYATTDAPILSNCNLWGNPEGDWVSTFAGQLGSNCNVSVDPQFCSVIPDDEQDWTLEEDSPCLGENGPCGTTIGAWPLGCADTPTETITWGGIKALFHRPPAAK